MTQKKPMAAKPKQKNKAIALSKSQEIGFSKFCDRLDQLRAEVAEETKQVQAYLVLCLNEAGIEDGTGWSFNEPTREWRKPEDE